jgi:hypothetical protein
MAKPKGKFLCHTCKLQQPLVPNAPNTNSCLRCKLKLNKVLLLRCFDAITSQDDMKTFKAEMETWYLNDA